MAPRSSRNTSAWHTLLTRRSENDLSATGFLPPRKFERVADAFFAEPTVSVRGWERALDAQRRIVAEVQAIDGSDTTRGTVAIVSHGAVGALLSPWRAIDHHGR